MPTDEMYTVEQAATLAGVEASAIWLAIRQGELRAWTLPAQRGLLVRKNDLKAWAHKGDRVQVVGEQANGLD